MIENECFFVRDPRLDRQLNDYRSILTTLELSTISRLLSLYETRFIASGTDLLCNRWENLNTVSSAAMFKYISTLLKEPSKDAMFKFAYFNTDRSLVYHCGKLITSRMDFNISVTVDWCQDKQSIWQYEHVEKSPLY